jgi:hypothetical protein
MLKPIFDSLKAQYHKHERFIPAIAFVCGFLFDMTFLKRIDEPSVMLQQAAYLLIAILLLTVDLFELVQEIPSPKFVRKIWPYREFFLHFFLGTLLNSYTIFYFKSASGLTSFIFIFILITAMTLTEFKRFGKSQHQVHMALWSLCLISYFQSLLPILFGSIGVGMFLASGVASIAVFYLYYSLIKNRFPTLPRLPVTHVLFPYATIQIIFSILYLSHAIPPVPLSVTYMGVYHGVEKQEDGDYNLSYTRPWYKFWQHGDETFLARPGDTIVAFVQVFSPTGFKQQLQMRWSQYDVKRGWLSQDAIPLSVSGGREEGFRSIAKKSNYSEGEWRIQIETMDNREVGRFPFAIVSDSDTSDRDFHTEVR